MKIKEHSFISALILLPVTMFLGLLLITGYLSGKVYLTIFTVSFITFWMSFIFALFFTANEIINSNNRKRIFLLLFIPFIYLPIYYTKYVCTKNHYYGLVPAFLNIILLVGLFFSFKSFTYNYMTEKYVNVKPSFYTYIK